MMPGTSTSGCFAVPLIRDDGERRLSRWSTTRCVQFMRWSRSIARSGTSSTVFVRRTTSAARSQPIESTAIAAAVARRRRGSGDGASAAGPAVAAIV